MDSLTPYLIAISLVLIISVVVSKGAGRFGIPGLLIFLVIGMLAGRGGPGGFPFSNWLRVVAPLVSGFRFPIQYNPTSSLKNELVEIPVPADSAAVGRTLVDLALPAGALIVLIRRHDDAFVPRGSTQIEAGDTLLVLAEQAALERVRGIVGA